jgi:predicted RNA-binding Zn-ribbon protein involved in translation (DUF1610 family)
MTVRVHPETLLRCEYEVERRINVDVHSVHPPWCVTCELLHARDKACLEHTCPDCGAICWNKKNAFGELVHRC